MDRGGHTDPEVRTLEVFGTPVNRLAMQQGRKDLRERGERGSGGDDADVQHPVIDVGLGRCLGNVPVPARVADDDLERVTLPQHAIAPSGAR